MVTFLRFASYMTVGQKYAQHDAIKYRGKITTKRGGAFDTTGHMIINISLNAGKKVQPPPMWTCFFFR